MRYPSQKVIIDSQALDPKDKSQEGSDFTLPQAHGKGRLPTLFVDAHASITWYPMHAPDGAFLGGKRPGPGVWQIDPSGPNGWGTGSLD